MAEDGIADVVMAAAIFFRDFLQQRHIIYRARLGRTRCTKNIKVYKINFWFTLRSISGNSFQKTFKL